MPRVEIFRNVRKSGERFAANGAVGRARNRRRWNAITQKGEVRVDATGASTLGRSSATDAALLDLVEQRLVAHAENLRGLAPVPVHLAQRRARSRRARLSSRPPSPPTRANRHLPRPARPRRPPSSPSGSATGANGGPPMRHADRQRPGARGRHRGQRHGGRRQPPARPRRAACSAGSRARPAARPAE